MAKAKQTFLDWVIESLLLNNEINVVDDQYNNPVSVYDLSKTIHNLIYEESRGIIHVGSDTLCSRFEFANMIANCWNLNNNYIKPISTQDLSRKIKLYSPTTFKIWFDFFKQISSNFIFKEFFKKY